MTNDLTFDSLLPHSPFSEVHARVIDQPIDRVWQALLTTPADEIKLLKPLFSLRGVPARLTGKIPPAPIGSGPALELFIEEGFVMLRQDQQPVDGRAILIFGAAGKFWSPANNKPKQFDSAADFIAFDERDNVKTVARFELQAMGTTSTRIETETIVDGTDAASVKKFRPYWMLIRWPAGLLRRSWLAAIDRRANRLSS